MTAIIIYLVDSGIITRCVSCPTEMVDVQCGEGEAWIEHDRVNDAEFKVDLATLQVVPISQL